MKRQRGTSRRSLLRATVIPNPGFQELHRLLSRLWCLEDPTPLVRSIGLRLAWADANLRDGPIAVSINDDTAVVQGHIAADGSFEKIRHCDGDMVIALRNLAADPGRRFRRYGQETSRCPFCHEHLGFGNRSSVIGYCADCARRVGWPHDERAAKHAEDILRRDVIRELEDEDQEEGPREYER